MNSGEQFGNFLKTVKKNFFENKGNFGKFSREQGNTDPLGGFLVGPYESEV